MKPRQWITKQFNCFSLSSSVSVIKKVYLKNFVCQFVANINIAFNYQMKRSYGKALFHNTLLTNLTSFETKKNWKHYGPTSFQHFRKPIKLCGHKVSFECDKAYYQQARGLPWEVLCQVQWNIFKVGYCKPYTVILRNFYFSGLLFSTNNGNNFSQCLAEDYPHIS